MRLALPQDIAATTDAITVDGMGFGERGTFRLSASSGRFTRHALSERDRAPFAVSDLKYFHGGGKFLVQGPDLRGVVEGTCRYGETLERRSHYHDRRSTTHCCECAFRFLSA